MAPIRALAVLALLLLASCASLSGRDPLEVTVSGVEPLTGEGLELRMLVKLRVQNPNDTPVEYNGVALRLDVQGSTFATGVSDGAGSVPRYGEAVLAVPVTISAWRMAREMIGLMDGAPPERLRFELFGKLNGSGLGATRFRTGGELTLTADGKPGSLAP
jgi:LEA14-like dessication related protein